MRSALLTSAAMLLAATLAAQNPPPPGQGGGFQPPPDHWLTMDSVAGAVGLDSAQRAAIAEPYRALNGVMKEAAQKRAALRQRFQGMPRPEPGQPLTPEQQALRDSVRAEMDGLQSEADMWYGAIRNKLRADQQGKFDALPRPMVTFRRRMGGGPS
ncbi:MAG TPA: hypothetical protein VMH88_06095 [Gemmatimonadales bacterium]|nr:hypothetical protein [Gemmatimonadales bacterium]